MSACLSELYHKVGDFVVGKAPASVFSILNPLYFIHHKHKPTYLHNSLTNNIAVTAFVALPLSLHATPHTTTTLEALKYCHTQDFCI